MPPILGISSHFSRNSGPRSTPWLRLAPPVGATAHSRTTHDNPSPARVPVVRPTANSRPDRHCLPSQSSVHLRSCCLGLFHFPTLRDAFRTWTGCVPSVNWYSVRSPVAQSEHCFALLRPSNVEFVDLAGSPDLTAMVGQPGKFQSPQPFWRSNFEFSPIGRSSCESRRAGFGC